MAGIYVHFPFCKSRCYYCDFYSTTNLKLIDSYFNALKFEIELRKEIIADQLVETIYFGGGTPSLISSNIISLILEQIYQTFNVTEQAEITIELNPDDITNTYAKNLKKTGVNRISLGVQAFYNYHLRLMNRRHKVLGSLKAIEALKNANFDNISIDLIYGLPELTLHEWEKSLQKTISLNIQHISAYHLSYEPNTVFNQLKKKNIMIPISDNISFKQFEMMSEYFESNNFIHYEISSFGYPERLSKHNVNYWKNIPYLGLGPSAHSFDGITRLWNSSDISKYTRIDKKHDDIVEYEKLSEKDHFNEYIMTGLRTYWGIDLKKIESLFSKDLSNQTKQKSKIYIQSSHMQKKKNCLILTRKGMFISDKIITDLFMS